MIILELVDHLGRVKEHHKFSANSLSVGRSYDNDLTLNDPFVCPHHLQIDVSEEGLLEVHDLDSLNGLYAYPGSKRLESLQLAPNETLRIGHSILRYRRPDFMVAATRQDRLGFEFGNQLLSSRLLQWGSYLLLALLLTLFTYINSYHNLEPLQVFRSQLLPHAMALLVWTGFWALLSRILTHNFYFSAHSIIASLMLLVSLIYEDYLESVLRFAFNSDTAIEWLSYLVTMLIMSFALYAHLRFCSAKSSRYLVSVGMGLSAIMVGLTIIGNYSDGDDFSNYPHYHSAIMPAGYQLVSDLSLEEFVARSQQIRQTLEHNVLEGQKATAQSPEGQ